MIRLMTASASGLSIHCLFFIEEITWLIHVHEFAIFRGLIILTEREQKQHINCFLCLCFIL